MVEKEEDFEEFDEDEDEDEVVEKPRPVEVEAPEAKPRGRPKKETPKEAPVEEKIDEPIEPVAPRTQYVPIPRAVPIETMINELYDGQQEIKQLIIAVLSLLEKK